MNSNIEKLGAFYLGKEWSQNSQSISEKILMLDSKDLTTHAVCVGMTGSGKTGLCISLLEEAAIDGIPAIVIDPKGDISNLLLTFPDLNKESFLPWINPDDARKKGLSEDEFAEKQAELWKKGLSEWGQDGERIHMLKESSDITIYTPGSSSGRSLSILKSMDPPPAKVFNDPDLYGDTIEGTVTGILGLLGIDADPIQSQEHILLSSILDYYWKQNLTLDLVSLVQAVQSPPVSRIGVFDLETFYPSKDRFKLAMGLNNLIASPGFKAWLEGDSLDIDSLYYKKDGKPRISIISIAHLDEKERMFTVSLILNRLMGWMRSQSGTTSLRALFYMDEIFGYLPPVSNPPSKKPLLTLLKQARAFGLGLVLATQNPVDLDYKGLSNTGIWFIGRLQTDQDKDRVLDGLSDSSSSLDRQTLKTLLSSIQKRVFLLHNVHEEGPVLFHTRWAMSYLRGPLTRNQISSLNQNKMSQIDSKPESNAAPNLVKTVNPSTVDRQPVTPPGIQQYFIPVDRNVVKEDPVFYSPAVLGLGVTYFTDRKLNISSENRQLMVLELMEGEQFVNWDDGLSLSLKEDMLETVPHSRSSFDTLPQLFSQPKHYTDWSKSLREWNYRNQELSLLKSASTGEVSRPGESERDFRVRLSQTAREIRDEKIEEIRNKYQTKLDRLEDKIRNAEYKVAREEEQAKNSKMDTALSVGATFLGMFMGRKKLSRTTINRASTSMRRAGRTKKELQDVEVAKEKLEQLNEEFRELEARLKEEIQDIQRELDPSSEVFEPVSIRPKKMNTSVQLIALGWLPYTEVKPGRMQPAWLEITKS